MSCRVAGSPYSSLSFKSDVFAGWHRFGYFCIFFTINPLETQSPYCWALAGADGSQLSRLQEGLDIKNFKSEMFLKVIRHPVASAVFYDKVIRTFKGVCCGFPKEHQYSQDYDEVTNLPKGFYGPLDAVTGKREESGRLAHHLHGLMVSRYVKLHNVKQVMDEGGAKVMEWMSSVASCVMSEYVARQKLKDGTYAAVNPEITMGMIGEPKYIDHNKNILNKELPDLQDDETDKMEQEITRLQQSQVIHYHASRCVSKDGKKAGDDKGCEMGFEPGPAVRSDHHWDTDTETLALARSRTKIVSHNPPTSAGCKCNNCFTFIGDESARMIDESSEGMSIKEQCRKTCNYCGKYTAKMDDHSGEELIANMVSASEPKEDDKSVFQEKPKLMITKCVNAMHR